MNLLDVSSSGMDVERRDRVVGNDLECHSNRIDISSALDRSNMQRVDEVVTLDSDERLLK